MEHGVLVVGATGQNGLAVLPRLAAQGRPVRAASRHPEQVTLPGVEAVHFDWQQTDTYGPALEGADRVYLIVPEGMPGLPPLIRDFVAHAVAAGARRLVLLSALGVDHDDRLPLRQAELAMLESAPDWAILRANWFMQNFIGRLFRRQITAQGKVIAPAGDARVSFIDVEDIAASAAAVLARPTLGRSEYRLTGGEALTFGEAATLIGAAAGRRIGYEALDPADPDLMERMGVPGRDPSPVQLLFGRVRDGWEAPVSADVRGLTGHQPGSFSAFALRHAAAWAAQDPIAVCG